MRFCVGVVFPLLLYVFALIMKTRICEMILCYKFNCMMFWLMCVRQREREHSRTLPDFERYRKKCCHLNVFLPFSIGKGRSTRKKKHSFSFALNPCCICVFIFVSKFWVILFSHFFFRSLFCLFSWPATSVHMNLLSCTLLMWHKFVQVWVKVSLKLIFAISYTLQLGNCKERHLNIFTYLPASLD